MTLGFRANDDDEDTPEQVVDGVASEREPTLEEQGAAFVAVAKQLRELGCVEVRAGDWRAVWPVHAHQPPPVVHRVPVGPKESAPPPRQLERYEGEKLTAEDRERRQYHEDVKALVRGES